MKDVMKETLQITADLLARQRVFEAALHQLIEQLIRPDAAVSQRFAVEMRQRIDQLLADGSDAPHAETEAGMTLLLAALLESAGHSPQR